MRVLVIDNDTCVIEDLKAKIAYIMPDCEVAGFTNPFEALHYGKGNGVDMVFLEAVLRQMQGASLVKALRKAHPKLYTVFMAAHAGFALSAIKLHVDGYLLKPIISDEIKEELIRARTLHSQYEPSKIRVQCFGGFEVYHAGRNAVSFSRSKSKELFAYLIDKHGASATSAEIAAVLWPDRLYDRGIRSAVQTVISDMTRSLKRAGVFDVILRSRNAISIQVDRVQCDYYDYLAGDPLAANAYNGNYLTSYSWAEDTNGFLTARAFQAAKRR